MDFRVIAARIATKSIEARRKKVIEEDEDALEPEMETEGILEARSEYSCQIELSIVADFEGSANKNKLIKRIKKELELSIKNGLTTVARELELEPVSARVKPIKLECAVNDQTSES
jgi:hypothetical protein